MRSKIVRALQKATGEKEIQVEFPENEQFGDYATNVVMILAKKKRKRPGVLAKEIIGKLQKDKELTKIVSKIEVAGPGFINFWLSDKALISQMHRVQQQKDRYGSSLVGKGKKVVVEYSSPNIAKYFGIGHLRSTVIGQALYNLYKFLGYKAIGDNHLGDWGTQFGMVIAQVVRNNLDTARLNVADFERLYVEFNREVDKKPELMKQAKQWFKKLEEGEKRARKIWEKAKDTSLDEFKRIYRLLDIKIDNSYGESFYEDKMPKVINQVRKKGLSKKSRGAEIVEFDPSTSSGQALPPAMLLKSDGATTYYTRDLATVKFRIDKFKPEIIIYEVGSEQKLHFKQVFETAKRMGWLNGTELVHVAHGLIRFEGGKMSTRKGETVMLEEVLDEAIYRARKIIEKSETSRGFSKKEEEKIAKTVGIGAVKYFDLTHHPTSDIIFDWEKMFVLEGNSAPYLQYTIARTQSVLAKLKTQNSKRKPIEFSVLSIKLNEAEHSVLRSLSRFSEIIADSAKNYSPNILCNYLFDLAQKYNAFYSKHRILDVKSKRVEEQESKRNFRVALTKATGQVLKSGLTLLGIQSPKRM